MKYIDLVRNKIGKFMCISDIDEYLGFTLSGARMNLYTSFFAKQIKRRGQIKRTLAERAIKIARN